MTERYYIKEMMRGMAMYCVFFFIMYNSYLWWHEKPLWVPTITTNGAVVFCINLLVGIPVGIFVRRRLYKVRQK